MHGEVSAMDINPDGVSGRIYRAMHLGETYYINPVIDGLSSNVMAQLTPADLWAMNNPKKWSPTGY